MSTENKKRTFKMRVIEATYSKAEVKVMAEFTASMDWVLKGDSYFQNRMLNEIQQLVAQMVFAEIEKEDLVAIRITIKPAEVREKMITLMAERAVNGRY